MYQKFVSHSPIFANCNSNLINDLNNYAYCICGGATLKMFSQFRFFRLRFQIFGEFCMGSGMYLTEM